MDFQDIRRVFRTTAAIGLCISAVAGCSDGSGDSASPTQPSDLQVSITFPPDGSATGGADSFIVSGTVKDLSDSSLLAHEIESFTVNGAIADVDFDSGRWRSTVSLPPNESTRISTELVAVNGSALQAQVTVNSLPDRPSYRSLEVTAGGTEAVVAGLYGLRKVDLSSGEETVLVSEFDDGFTPSHATRTSSDGSTSYFLRRNKQGVYDAARLNRHSNQWSSIGDLHWGPYRWTRYPDFDLDEAGGRLIIATYSTNDEEYRDACSLVELSLDSGAVTTFADSGILPPQPDQVLQPFCPESIVVDAPSNQVIVSAGSDIDPELGHGVLTDQLGIYGYDLDTGVARVVSDEQTGNGPLLDSPRWLFPGDRSGQVLAVDDDYVIQVDVSTGDREMVLDNPQLPDRIWAIDYDPVHQRLLIVREAYQMVALSLIDGAVETLFTNTPIVGSGPRLLDGWPITIGESDQRLYSVDWLNNQIVAMSLSGLQREVVTSPILSGTDSLPNGVRAIALDEAQRQLYFDSYPFIFQLDLNSGIVELVKENSAAQLPPAIQVSALSVDPHNRVLYASAATSDVPENGIISINLGSGEWQVLSDAAPGEQNNLVANVYDAELERLLTLTATGDIVSVDRATGERSVLAANTNLPEAGDFGVPRTIALDSIPDSVLVGYTQGVVAVDLSSGARSVVTDELRHISIDRSAGVIYGSTLSTDIRALDRYTGESATVFRVEY